MEAKMEKMISAQWLSKELEKLIINDKGEIKIKCSPIK
jgi:hypothetical protein